MSVSEKEYIENVISNLRSNKHETQAYFGIFHQGEDSVECFIKANEPGLKMFIAELLEGLNRVDETLSLPTNNIIGLDLNGDWVDESSDFVIQYIHPVIQSTDSIRTGDSPKTVKDRAFELGCLIVIGFLFLATIIGLITMMKYLF